MKFFKRVRINNLREIRILGTPLLEYTQGESMLSLKIPKRKTLEEKLSDAIFDMVDDKYDTIFLSRSGLGEAYLLSSFIKSWCKKLGTKNPCVVTIHATGKDWKSFYDCKFYNLRADFDSMASLEKPIYEKNGQKLILFLPYKEINKIVSSYQNEPKPHIESLLSYAGLKDFDIENVQPIFTKEMIKNAENHLKKNNINKDNFIFISRYANSIPNLPENFWDDLILELKAKGYSICENSKDITCSEAVYLATFAKSVIAMRSGFIEGLTKVAKNMHVFYTPLKKPYLDTEKFMSVFSLKNYPFVNPDTINEYNAENTDLIKLTNDILKNF